VAHFKAINQSGLKCCSLQHVGGGAEVWHHLEPCPLCLHFCTLANEPILLRWLQWVDTLFEIRNLPHCHAWLEVEPQVQDQRLVLQVALATLHLRVLIRMQRPIQKRTAAVLVETQATVHRICQAHRQPTNQGKQPHDASSLLVVEA